MVRQAWHRSCVTDCSATVQDESAALNGICGAEDEKRVCRLDFSGCVQHMYVTGVVGSRVSAMHDILRIILCMFQKL